MVIDAGPAAERRDAGARVVVPFLAAARRRSVAASGHLPCTPRPRRRRPAVLDRFPAGLVLEPGATGRRSAVYRVSPARPAGSPGTRRAEASASPSTACASRCSIPSRLGPGGARTSTRTRWSSWWSTALPGALRRRRGIPRGRGNARAGSAGWTCSRWAITGAEAARATRGSTRCGPGSRSSRWVRTTTATPRRRRWPGSARTGSTVCRTDQEGTITVTTDGARMTGAQRRGQPRARRPLGGRPTIIIPGGFVQTSVTTIERFILDQETATPRRRASCPTCSTTSRSPPRSSPPPSGGPGWSTSWARPAHRNVQGEEQQKLDVFANETIKNCLKHTGRVCVMGSEEDEDIIPVPPEYPVGKYAVLFDPLDGSSNIDVNSAVGTIFSIYRRVSMDGRGTSADVLQPGCKQVAAGYVMYGSSTMLVYTTGQGVHGFTLDPTIGEFLLSHPRIMTPRVGQVLQREREQLRPVGQGDADRGARTQGRHARRDEAQEQPLHRVAGRRLPPQPDRRRDLPLSGGHQESQRQAAAAVRGEPDGVHRRAGGGVGDRRRATASWTSCPTDAAPADAAGHRLAGGCRVRGRHAAATRPPRSSGAGAQPAS